MSAAFASSGAASTSSGSRTAGIAEQVVYTGTAPVRAFRSGHALEPITKF